MSLGRDLSLLNFGDGFKGVNNTIVIDQGNTVPTDATSGYAVGCIFLHRDGGEGTAFYINEGTEASCDFNAMATLTAAQEALLGATAGTVSASKAVVVDSSSDITAFHNITATGAVAAATAALSGAITNATHALAVASSDVATSGTVRAAEIVHTVGASDLDTVHEGFYSSVNSAYTTGTWTNAIVGRIEYTGGTGKADGGMAASICAEMNMPAAAQSGGIYTTLDCEMNCPTSFVHADNAALPVSFIRFGLFGEAKGEFDDHGVLFHIDGLTAGSGDCFDSTIDTAAAQIDHTLKININGAIYYIPLMDNANGS